LDQAVCQSTDVHRRARSHGLVGRSTRRSTIQRVMLSGNGPGRPAESSALCNQFRSTGWSTGQRAVTLCFQAQSTGGTTVIKMTVGRSTGRSTGRAKMPFPAANEQNCLRLYIPHFLSCFRYVFVLDKFLESKIFNLYKYFTSSF